MSDRMSAVNWFISGGCGASALYALSAENYVLMALNVVCAVGNAVVAGNRRAPLRKEDAHV